MVAVSGEGVEWNYHRPVRRPQQSDQCGGNSIGAHPANVDGHARPVAHRFELEAGCSVAADFSNTPRHYTLEFRFKTDRDARFVGEFEMLASGPWQTPRRYTHRNLNIDRFYQYRITARNDKGMAVGLSVPDDAPGDTPQPDTDGDGFADGNDNCPDIPNADQSNMDRDAHGDVCDVDIDNDGLIEIYTLMAFDNIRHDLAGASYNDDPDNAGNSRGCPPAECSGYELMVDVDFATSGIDDSAYDGDTTSSNGNWMPVGSFGAPFTGIVEGNGHTIAGLHVDRDDLVDLGLFGVVGSGGQLRNLALTGATVITNIATRPNLGLLAGTNNGRIVGCNSNGRVIGSSSVRSLAGGLVGVNGGTIAAGWSSASVIGSIAGENIVGGLVGWNNAGTIVASWTVDNGDTTTANATGGGSNHDRVGGLVGQNSDDGIIVGSYSLGDVSNGADANGGGQVGGLVGWNAGTVATSYATGSATARAGTFVGKLIGFADNRSTGSYGLGEVDRVMTSENNREDRSIDTCPAVIPTADNIPVNTTIDDCAWFITTADTIGNDRRWPRRLWDFGTAMQTPAVKWATGYTRDDPSTVNMDEATFSCDPDLLPADATCFTTIVAESVQRPSTGTAAP